MLIDLQTVIITPQILNLIAEIDEFKGSWQFIKRIAPNRLSQLKKIATIESIGSSTRIEGAKLTDKEVKLLLSDINKKSFENRDEQEVAGYAYACEMITEHFENMRFSESLIKQIHTWVLKYSLKNERHRGCYKHLPIHIEAFSTTGKSLGILFETTSPLETPIKMQELIEWTQEALTNKSLHPLLIIALFVVIFLAIHPFQDGNGRLSRLLTTLLMLQNGYSFAPYSSLESIIEANKESYYQALQITQKAWQNDMPDWNPWLQFFLQGLQRQKRHLEIKISREFSLMKELSPLSRSILELLKEHGQLGIKDLEILTKANRNTIKKTLSSLVRDSYIVLNGTGKGSWYTLN